MIFIELMPFIAFAQNGGAMRICVVWNFLLLSPDAGDVIPGGSGLRKLRWAAQERGKQGGARVIYCRHVPGECVYLIYAYAKSARENMTREQLRLLSQLMREITHG